MRKVALLILDGWGHGNHSKSDGIYNANTPFIDSLEKTKPNSELVTYGTAVGLPEGQMGNSEVGHLNIGAGRIVYQELTRINHAVETGTFQNNKTILQIFDRVKKNGKKLHFMGLMSDGGVHSSQEHLFELCKMAKAHGLERVYIHAFTDGRDCDPHAGIHQIKKLSAAIAQSTGKIATLIGRYYAMDRDNRWERIKLAYDAMVKGVGDSFDNPEAAIKHSYASDVSDEFITPKIIDAAGNIEAGDSVICFNFRTDRCREISTVLTQRPELDMKPLDIDYTTMTNYDHSFKNVNVIFEKDDLKNTLGEIVANAGLTQVRIAETEKYPHVTFFFSGGREKPFENEKRLLINSPKVATYDLQPEMSAPEITASICTEMETNQPDFICLNFANTDMVGHTGNYEAILKAAETVDGCAKTIVELGEKLGYDFVIIADHGNSDFAINPDGTPNTAHSLNPVPVIVLSDKTSKVKAGSLRDVAPTILDLMGVAQPKEMTGTSLIEQ
ncbi:2,3-bisphosphoglycerate-independent phosphoglycerate mutase [Putridiphycobacter roseus]|uniref:2,3-bisphosphoglycerate-independent phosphoglycerate mutase n=1 Tax=Putridiphycobacter roseus TaxID=2219161 RepID=A0A2W1NL31_9FLAO|nr:2,3-bisphosphoglycerate-independent phosphoglycerate mutase [Putridiphycobacter roseus]PZE16372.1 2,3-bisphosphoglycerate-independent phosphoglycerate mutase [Putridiphycobacter roseus]